MTEKEKQRILKANMALGMTKEEAEKALADDIAIDKGQRLEWEPSLEEEKAMRKATKLIVPREKKVKGTRTKKVDEDKKNIISLIASTITENYENANIVNNECQIDFEFNGQSFSVKLTKHRATKE